MKFTPVIVSLVYVFRVNHVYSESNCCDLDVHIVRYNATKQCENGKMLPISCVLQKESSDVLDHFEVYKDEKGEYIDVDEFMYSYIIRSPQYVK